MKNFIEFIEFAESTNWINPDIEEEQEEIDRTAEDLNINQQLLQKCIHNAKLVDLTDIVWSKMSNTDSWNAVEPGNLIAAEKLSQKYDRDLERIIKTMRDGGTLPAPIVLLYGKTPYLIAGNTRLMAARAMKIRPLVLLAYIKEQSN